MPCHDVNWRGMRFGDISCAFPFLKTLKINLQFGEHIHHKMLCGRWSAGWCDKTAGWQPCLLYFKGKLGAKYPTLPNCQILGSWQLEKRSILSPQLGPPVVPFYPFFGGEVSPTKIDKTEKTNKKQVGTLILTSQIWRTQINFAASNERLAAPEVHGLLPLQHLRARDLGGDGDRLHRLSGAPVEVQPHRRGDRVQPLGGGGHFFVRGFKGKQTSMLMLCQGGPLFRGCKGKPTVNQNAFSQTGIQTSPVWATGSQHEALQF